MHSVRVVEIGAVVLREGGKGIFHQYIDQTLSRDVVLQFAADESEKLGNRYHLRRRVLLEEYSAALALNFRHVFSSFVCLFLPSDLIDSVALYWSI